MQDNRNTGLSLTQDCRGTVCIDTRRVLDSCKDRDCFENVRVYLTNYGEEVLSNATNIRIKSAEINCAYVGVNEVAFNNGFYQVTVRYYITLEIEACQGCGRSQCIKGLAALEKSVVLYGGEGNVTSFSSNPESGYCAECTADNATTSAPIAIVETVEPIVLGYKVRECGCNCSCGCDCDNPQLPDTVRCCMDGEISTSADAPRLYVSFGVFSVVRIERPAQLLVQATDYSVPDKECCTADNNDSPCDLFRTMAFPTSRFRTSCNTDVQDNRGGNGGCGCGRGNG